MAKSSKQSYETKWQKAFENTGVQPSAQLWKNIESDLNAAENAKFKRRLLFYRMATAAAVAALVILGIYTWNNELMRSIGGKQEVTIAEQKTDTNTSEAETEALAENIDDAEGTDSVSTSFDTTTALADNAEKSVANAPDRTAIADNTLQNTTEGNTTENKRIAEEDAATKQKAFTGTIADHETAENTVKSANAASDENKLSEEFERHLLVTAMPAQGIDDSGMLYKNLDDPVDQIYPIPVMPKDRKNGFQPVFYAGLNLSTDYFNPNYNAQSAMEASAPNTFADELQTAAGNYYQYNRTPQNLSTEDPSVRSLGEENTAQLSFSYGANFGMAINEHWSIESGVAYSKYNTSSETSATFQGIAADEAYPVSLANSNVENIRQFSSVRYEETTLTNTFDFVTVPMKIGYNLHFDRISVVFGTGVAANFLLQNSINDDAGRLNEVTIRPDENSPFRKVYYSGILSGGIHYQLVENYAFTLTPSYNFPISSLTKSESNFMSLPYYFGINFGLRYQF